MPNHVYQRLEIIASDDVVAQITKKVFVDEANSFSADRIYPTPQELVDTVCGGKGSIGLQVWHGTEEEWKSILSYDWVTLDKTASRKDLQEFLLCKNKEYKTEGDKCAANIKKYGFADWYGWRIENWGTKWGIYSAEWDNDVVLFQSAWSPANQIIQKLSLMFPSATFNLSYVDEGGGFVGTYDIENGNMKDFDCSYDSEEGKAIIESLGMSYWFEDEEEEEE